VTPWTIGELQASLRDARAHVEERSLPRREFADILVQESQDEVVAAYWIAYRDRGTHPPDFFDFHDHFESLLAGQGIEVVAEGVTAVDRGQDAIDAQLELLERHKGPGAPRKVLEHDAKHRLLIERLRGHANLRFTNARYWFLTRDGKPPPYAQDSADEASVQLPFCASTSAWLQVMRSITPRTENLDKTMVDLLASACIPMHRSLPAVVRERQWQDDKVQRQLERLQSRSSRCSSRAT
jgi:hypothetical protein